MTFWPEGVKYRPIDRWPVEHTERRRRSPFRTTLAGTVSELRTEIRQFPMRNVVLSLAITETMLRNDGMPRSDARPAHPGVILSFETKDAGALSFPGDSFTSWEDNLLAIVRTINALRSIDRYGVTRHAEQFASWRAIEARPASEFASVDAAISFLVEVVPIEWAHQVDRDNLRGLLRLAQRAAHPDSPTGDHDKMSRVNRAAEYLAEHDVL